MARPASKYPTELELEILKVLWRVGPVPVRVVRDELVGFRVLAYTSVMTILNIMVNKGYLTRKKDGASFRYRTKIRQKSTTWRMLRDLVDRAFDGSASAAMVNLLEAGELNDDEIASIRKLLDSHASRNKS